MWKKKTRIIKAQKRARTSDNIINALDIYVHGDWRENDRTLLLLLLAKGRGYRSRTAPSLLWRVYYCYYRVYYCALNALGIFMFCHAVVVLYYYDGVDGRVLMYMYGIKIVRAM